MTRFISRWALGLLLVCSAGTTMAQNVTNVCKGEQACLVVGSHRGVVQWQSSADMNNWSAEASGDTLCFAATTTMYYRAVVTEGTCAPIYTDTSYVIVNDVIADAGADVAVCLTGNETLGGSPTASGGTGPYTYNWAPGTGLSATNIANPTASITGTFTYMVTVTDANGCMDVDTVEVDTNGAAAPGSMVFNYTGGVQTFTVPPCVTTITINACGAQGGANWVNNVNYGGCMSADIAVTPGEVLNVYVGEQPQSTAGGYNGGGAGDAAGRGGGGGSDVRRGSTLNDRLVVGGGGGGAGYWSSLHVIGGVGGGMNGGDGSRNGTDPGGLGATQTAGGANGTCSSLGNPSMAGTFGQGGTTVGFGCGCEGYGGGGGWYGGAASGNCRGGGGGSGYAIPAATNVVPNAGVQVGNGQVTISW